MSAREIDEYLSSIPEPGRSTLAALRTTILAHEPDVEEGLSYGHPAFKLGGKTIAGFAAHKAHLGYMPHSGNVVSALGSALDGFDTTKGSVKFPLDVPLPERIVAALIAARKSELGLAP
jgi:uncharacterized protein YdhG (YjbR/CyaY superfamily)